MHAARMGAIAFQGMAVFLMGYSTGIAHMAREVRSIPLEEMFGVGVSGYPAYLEVANVYIKLGLIGFFLCLIVAIVCEEYLARYEG